MNTSILSGMSIIIVPSVKKQRRKHRKKRINKKWAKRYGFVYHTYLKDGDIVMTSEGMMMNKVTYETMRIALELKENNNETAKKINS